jgi:hypothetical protein
LVLHLPSPSCPIPVLSTQTPLQHSPSWRTPRPLTPFSLSRHVRSGNGCKYRRTRKSARDSSFFLQVMNRRLIVYLLYSNTITALSSLNCTYHKR